MAELSDVLLASKAASGDVQAFEVLARRYQLPIYRLCLGMLGNPHEAEEAAQDTFFTAWRAIGRFRGDAKFSTWLYRVATNRCLKHAGRRPPYGQPLPETPTVHGNPEAELEANEQLRSVAAAIADLTPHQRAVFVLREVDGLAYGDIAEVLGVTMTAVKSRLNRARVEIARSLDNDQSHGTAHKLDADQPQARP